MTTEEPTKKSNNVGAVAVAGAGTGAEIETVAVIADDDGYDCDYDDDGCDDYGDVFVIVYTVRCSNRLLPE